MTGIPDLDAAQPDFAAAFVRACRDVGFVSVTGHGIGAEQLAAMRSMLIRLFDVDDEVKHLNAITRDNYRGFIPLGQFSPNRAEVNGTGADAYEGFKLHWECPVDHPIRAESHLYGSNLWAAHVPDMAETVLSYWAACDAFTVQLLDIIADELGVSRSRFRDSLQAPLTNMTLLHYPPDPADGSGRSSGIHAHKDTNVLTLLHPDPVGGLEIRERDGSWTAVDADPRALVVNIGEMLELWSGGQLTATPHRVVNRSDRDRYSFPYFAVPRHDVVVEPLVAPRAGFVPTPMPVGLLSAEVWRTNWPDEQPSSAGFDLGALDR